MNQYDSYFAYYDIQVDNPLKSQQIIGWLKTVDYILVHSILNQLQMNWMQNKKRTSQKEKSANNGTMSQRIKSKEEITLYGK